jgi:phosphoglycerate dehydrogenase-like enzyme
MMSEWRVGCIDVWAPEVQETVRAHAPDGFVCTFAAEDHEDDRIRAAEGCDFILGAKVTRRLLAHAPNLRLVQKWGIGIDTIDLEACREAGVPVAITAGANASVVAEFAVMMMLAVYRRLPWADSELRKGNWTKPALRATCRQIRGKHVGIYGFGAIGRMVARKLAGFEAKLFYYDLHRADEAVERALGVTYLDADRLLAESDILTIHTPLTAATRDLINRDSITRMKDGAVVINTARGGIVDEPALHEALRSGKLFGAGLDGFDPEPPLADNPLLDLAEIVVAPHAAGSAFDNVPNVARHAFGNMVRALNGEPLPPTDVIVPQKA